jgi:hypothetical protein
MHSAALPWSYTFRLWHAKAVSSPEACFLRICVSGRRQIAAVVARIENEVRLAPIRRNRAHRILDHVATVWATVRNVHCERNSSLFGDDGARERTPHQIA